MLTRKRALLVVMVVAAGLVATVFMGGQARAAGTPISLTTSPVSLDLHIKPGTTSTQTLQFKNNSAIALPITMQVKVFGAYGAAGQAAISQPSPGDASTSWISLTPSSFTAQPNVWTAVKLTIKLPASANLGYYYAVIFKPTLPAETPASRSTAIKGSNAILVLVDSNSANEKRQVQVSNFSVTKHVYEYLPAHFSVTLRNGGNIYLAPSGDIFISRHSNMSNTIATIPFNHGGANILPNSNRDFKAVWTDGFPVFQQKKLDGQPLTSNKGQPEEQLVWNFSKANKFRFGKYYAQLALTYQDGTASRLVISQVSFWVIPWLLLLGGFAVLVLVGIGLWSIGRSLFKKFRGVNSRRK
jgi:hypothetical protein